MSDPQFRLATLAGAFVVVVVIFYVRFCGSVALPPKPPPPTGPSGTQRELLTKTSASPQIFKDYVASDAASAGVRAPSLEEISRKFTYRVDDARHVLDASPIEIAGLRLRIERTGEHVVLVVENLVASDLAYAVTTAPSSGEASCTGAPPLPFNAMVIGKGLSERRTECVWREGMSIVVTKAETLEVPPLSAWYLSQLPPSVVGISPRIARGHRGVTGTEKCSPLMSQVLRTSFERGTITWRDLADFYARHRCQTYTFPLNYRAFKEDGERALPVVD